MLATLHARPTTFRPALRSFSSVGTSSIMAPKRKTPAAAAAAPASKSAKKGLAKGDQFPTLPKLVSDEETEIDLNAVLKDTGILLFSYPRANTGGCTAQAKGFNENFAALEKAGFKVFGLSADKPKSQANWRAKHSFQFNLLCDPTHELALKKLGWSKGGTSVARSHVVVEKGGKVLDYQSPISPKDSVALGVEVATKKK